MRREGRLLVERRWDQLGLGVYCYALSNKEFLTVIRPFRRDGKGKYKYRVNGQDFITQREAFLHVENTFLKSRQERLFSD